jgi:ssDNA-binding Zn-finger/Zn-ribbon topoisomerase 1
MGLLSNPKCHKHFTELKLAKNNMGQLYYYCPDCDESRQNKIEDKKNSLYEIKQRLEAFELKLESFIHCEKKSHSKLKLKFL